MNSKSIGFHRSVWLKRNLEMVDEIEKYCNRYRLQKCASCDEETKQKQRCRVYSSGKCYCDKMIKARTEKFRQTAQTEIALLVNIEHGNVPFLKPKAL